MTYTIVAPTGQACDWTRSLTTGAAINKLLGTHRRRLWDYATTQGYRIRIEQETTPCPPKCSSH